MIQGHGDDLFLFPKGQIKSNFSSNVYYGKDTKELFRHLNKQWHTLSNYPEPQPVSAEKEIAEMLQLTPDSVCLTNGATEAIYLIAQTFRERRSGIFMPTFSEYGDACRLHMHKIIPLYDIENLPDNLDILWLCNPNNPTGQVFSISQIRQSARRHPNTLFVIDHSYEHFTYQDLLTAHEAATYPNIILLHSLTKTLALPGLRIGFLTGSPELTSLIRLQRMPWSVNAMAIETVHYVYNHPDILNFNLDALLQEKDRVAQKLSEIPTIEVWPSETHMLLVRLRNGKASALKNYLAETHGILIRDASNFQGLDEHFFRIAIQSQEENNNLINAIQEWILM